MHSAAVPRAARPAPPTFRDRAEAGLLLGERVRAVLREMKEPDPERSRVFAIPRGGVAVGKGVAHCLGVSLDLIVVRKVGHPDAPEMGLGAIAEGGDGAPVFDDDLLAQVGLARADLQPIIARERAELARRVAAYRAPTRGGPDAAELAGAAAEGSVAVIVDDGLATGVTARAAVRAVRARGFTRMLLAVPVAAPAAAVAMAEELRQAAGSDDEGIAGAEDNSSTNNGTGSVVTLVTPYRFRSVGEWYADFGQLTDADVLTLLSAGETTPRTPRTSR